MALSSSELARKLLHVAMGGFACALRFLTWPQAAACALAAFVFNWQVLPRIGGKGLWRTGDAAKGYPIGILLYPLAVLGLILAFRHDLALAASVWGVIAFGDGMATLAGQLLGGPRLPWNRGKSWAGFSAFVICGASAAAVLRGWTMGADPTAWFALRPVAVSLALGLFCALVEAAPTALDDNLTVPLLGALVLALLNSASLHVLLAQPALGRTVLIGLVVNLVLAALALRSRSIDVAGALSAVVIGTSIVAGATLRGFALMLAFFVIGSAVTKVGYGIKAARGIAQEKGGARGWRNAWANGGVAAFLALAAGGSPEPLRTLLILAMAAAVATAAADTCSSEIGKAYGRRTFLITSLRPARPGDEGAVSLEGTLGGLGGAALIAGLGWALGLLPGPLAFSIVALSGLAGSLVESAVGAVAERRGYMDNHLLNAFNTAVGAGLAATAWSVLR